MDNGRVLAPFRPERHNHARCITDALEVAERQCARDGLSFTPLRRRVLELVWSSHGPIGAYDVLDGLRKERRRAAPPTVYRALDFLMTSGLIHRIESLNAYVGCGDPRRRHGGQFLICRDCGSVAELNDKGISRAVSRMAGTVGFSVDEQTVEITGQCPRCQNPGDANADRQ